jgi:ATP-dependent Clp protease ATP-binding subunit ClpA
MVLAQAEAGRLNHNYIGTEHLLLGLVAEGEGIAARVLASFGAELNKVRSSVEFIIGRGDRMVIGDISLTPRAKKVIELAIDEARLLNHNYIGTEHLLLGLIREGEGIAAGVLESLGVDMAGARRQIIEIVSRADPLTNVATQGVGERRARGGLPEVTAPKDNVITCRIDSSDLEALDALIEAGIRSTRSDAAAWLIHAGIQANLDLFDRVYATVAEIKRLREQAQSAAKGLESSARLRTMRRKIQGAAAEPLSGASAPNAPTTPTEPDAASSPA